MWYSWGQVCRGALPPNKTSAIQTAAGEYQKCKTWVNLEPGTYWVHFSWKSRGGHLPVDPAVKRRTSSCRPSSQTLFTKRPLIPPNLWAAPSAQTSVKCKMFKRHDTGEIAAISQIYPHPTQLPSVPTDCAKYRQGGRIDCKVKIINGAFLQ